MEELKLNTAPVKEFFKKYFDIYKEVFKVTKNEIYYWSDKEKAEAQCRIYQGGVFNNQEIRDEFLRITKNIWQ